MLTESDLESDISPVAVPPTDTVPPTDKINNLVQKETNLARAGVTRYKYMCVIADALVAVKMEKSSIPDADGRYNMIEVPDAARRQWGAEQAAKLYGDMIERKEIEHDLGDKTLERYRSMSVAELKAQAQAILQGPSFKRKPVIEA